jgi:N-acetylmuramoyl-L-alanine amidase
VTAGTFSLNFGRFLAGSRPFARAGHAAFWRLLSGLSLLVGLICAQPAAFAQTPTPAAAAVPVAGHARLAGDGERTRFVIDLSTAIDFTAFTLADPYRVIIDLPQVRFDLPPGTGQGERGLVRAFRYGQVMPGAARIVMDLSAPARLERVFVVEATGSEPARLVVDLVRGDRDAFLRGLGTEIRPSGASVQKRAERTPRFEPQKRSDDRRPLIVLDPGHGGIDSGTISGGVAEKDLVFDFSQVLRERLERSGRYRVVMTRREDRFIPLNDRVKFAREQNADLFISLHANALPAHEGSARGLIVFTLSDRASDQDAARLAEQENRSDVIAGIDLTQEPDEIADILIDLTRRETMGFSHQFARLLVNEVRPVTRLHQNPHKSAGFRVLRAPDVPSVLVELGFVTSPADLRLMTSDAWRQRVAEAMGEAVDAFFRPRLLGALGASGQERGPVTASGSQAP